MSKNKPKFLRTKKYPKKSKNSQILWKITQNEKTQINKLVIFFRNETFWTIFQTLLEVSKRQIRNFLMPNQDLDNCPFIKCADKIWNRGTFFKSTSSTYFIKIKTSTNDSSNESHFFQLIKLTRKITLAIFEVLGGQQ